MKLTEMPLMTDENIDADVVKHLRLKGFDVSDIVENQLMGIDDEQILDLAYNQDRIVVTHDSDFGTLAIAAAKPFTGIIYLKPGHINASFIKQSIDVLLDKIEEVFPPFIVVVHHGKTDIRIRYRQK